MEQCTRRTFFGAAALAGAAIAGFGLSGCAPQERDAGGETGSKTGGLPETWDAEADVIVVGAGGTGLSAACAAANAGASVLVYEVDIKPGGTTALSQGVLQAAGTQVQKELSDFKDDTPEVHARCYLAQSEGLAEESLVSALCDRAPEMIEWLTEIGLSWKRVYGNCHVPNIDQGLHADRIHVYEGGGGEMGGGIVLTDALYAEAQRLGATFEFDSRAEGLVHDPEKGVVGVRVKQGSSTVVAKAKKGVILACGGIDCNEQLAKALNYQQYWDLTTQTTRVTPFNMGDGLIMGMALDAALATCGGTIDYDSTTFQGLDNSAPQIPCIMVNGSGRRFVCEDATYAYQYRAVFQQEMQLGKPTYTIMDQNMVEQGVGPVAKNLDKMLAEGKVVASDTLEGLAEAIDVPARNLVGAFEAWNGGIAETGQDLEFGRNTQLIKLDKPPYYASRNVSGNLGSLGGLMIDDSAQVVTTKGEVIPRLYAGGMNSGGWYGSYYPGSGTSIMGGLVFGRIAGEGAAGAEPWE